MSRANILVDSENGPFVRVNVHPCQDTNCKHLSPIGLVRIIEEEVSTGVYSRRICHQSADMYRERYLRTRRRPNQMIICGLRQSAAL